MKHRLARILTTAAVLTGASLIAPVANAAPAAAAAGCSGTQVDQSSHSYGGEVIAVVGLYWDGTNNCVIADKKGSYYGVSSKMTLALETQKGTSNSDSGFFSYYAGPVKLNGKNTCVAYELVMYKPGGRDVIQHRVPVRGYFHCG
ncbi:hypothetical protein [Streptomyces sindenensis]|uniref:hypothetical protein n=1 Tax=Streptomyces sindenensis TaxID=67363 RepID=UPI001678DFF9|nr:hypothetical protein [Streptomyces sindenensis]GGP56643.1 hypothetical protein GCM10010231_29410 [Streptomyces sindenensis]